ncbi:MAG: glycoside hydrolase family 65 protein [Lachnospiraceae bacterium]|nr:glycoside hydrolase family 65 protein [Lachnospiraceae bacterium]
MLYKISETGYNKEMYADAGNRFLIGNGYLGVRGTYDEYEKEMLPAVNLAGVYHKVGDGWCEPLNAPNGLYAFLKVDGKELKIGNEDFTSNEMCLDFLHGILKRETIFELTRGHITFTSERWADAADPHRVFARYKILADFHADVEVYFGTDTDIWELNGPHYESMDFDEKEGILTAVAPEYVPKENESELSYIPQIKVYTGERFALSFAANAEKIRDCAKYLNKVCFVTDANVPYEITKLFAVYTSKDGEKPLEDLKNELYGFGNETYDKSLADHKEIWEKRFSDGGVVIEGDREAKEAEIALNYSLYHLNSIAPRHAADMSIPARGLSGQTYKGAIFWDTEMFMLDYFLMTDPKVARSLVMYRVKTLQGALKKAESYGLKGAFYAWESQEGGFDACSDYNVTDVFTGRPVRTYFKDKQIHISAAVVYGILKYVEYTGDHSVLSEGGEEVIRQCAAFYKSCLTKRYGSEKWELLDVIGPDEYHERVNNNAYTNRMAKYVFENAAKLLSMHADTSKEATEYKILAENLKQQEPGKDGVIPQFDGYFDLEDVSLCDVRKRLLNEKEYWGGANGVASHTRIIKQADVVAMLGLFPDDHSVKVLRKNLEFYEPRTEHGSSLSACMYALLMCRLNMPDEAFPFFMKSAESDIKGGGKQWAGLVYIGGTHPAADGGAYKTMLYGFAGVSFEGGKINITPKLPRHITRLAFGVRYKNKKYKIDITRDYEHCYEIPD